MSTAAATGHPPTWFRSSYSNGAGGECVECAISENQTHVRDSKDAGGRVITVGHDAWVPFVQAIRGKRPAG
ncbi:MULTISPECIES: DUF397 domain-containing protein [Streptomyces]|uniref:DUF397 domain-containing protein n=1 Tax=Streptomyces fimbriatus TaxID=68197 RepID=A0ABW0DB87_STRFI